MRPVHINMVDADTQSVGLAFMCLCRILQSWDTELHLAESLGDTALQLVLVLPSNLLENPKAYSYVRVGHPSVMKTSEGPEYSTGENFS